MLRWLMRLVRWLVSLFRRRKPSPAEPLSPGFFPRSPGPVQPPLDPYSRVRHPLFHRPSGRSAAVAVEEPEEDETLSLVAR